MINSRSRHLRCKLKACFGQIGQVAYRSTFSRNADKKRRTSIYTHSNCLLSTTQWLRNQLRKNFFYSHIHTHTHIHTRTHTNSRSRCVSVNVSSCPRVAATGAIVRGSREEKVMKSARCVICTVRMKRHSHEKL